MADILGSANVGADFQDGRNPNICSLCGEDQGHQCPFVDTDNDNAPVCSDCNRRDRESRECPYCGCNCNC